MKIGVLTGGGDVPGLNPCIKAIVDRCVEEGHEALGIRRGWAGLLGYQLGGKEDDANVLLLDKNTVRRIARTGGTFLHTSRTNPGSVKPKDVPEHLRGPDWTADQPRQDFTPHVLKVIEELGLDVIIAIGGDDTLSYAERPTARDRVMSIPKTMDNDVFGQTIASVSALLSPAVISSTICAPVQDRTSALRWLSCSTKLRRNPLIAAYLKPGWIVP
jgi:6-phosphofructokinase 1